VGSRTESLRTLFSLVLIHVVNLCGVAACSADASRGIKSKVQLRAHKGLTRLYLIT